MQSTRIKICCAGFLFILLSCHKKAADRINGENPSGGTGTSTGNPKPPQGWDVGSGGNAYAAEFKDIGQTVVRRLKAKNVREVKGVLVGNYLVRIGGSFRFVFFSPMEHPWNIRKHSTLQVADLIKYNFGKWKRTSWPSAY